ncbi:AraC family transcriptional regulator [Marinobacter excellens]|jgi:AraC-like DNA-binding protein|uniref:BenABC operon transcriptional activator BenR n=1 Tax=Marinobacter excellens LAMA 842 TaxID=1306954 RepID=A0A137S340_9GAMM|nr:AraC family transcriptional regulator [Marinobacter excellens]KXO06844.1 benABC operon transcriptional activator BenR [Marinobacter excellens LAMA 842]
MTLEIFSLPLRFNFARPEAVSEFVNQKVGRHTLEVIKCDAARSRLGFKEFSGLGLTSISYGSEVRVKSPELESVFHLQIITRGTCYVSFGYEGVLLGVGDAIMLNPFELIILEYSSDCEKLIVNIPESSIQTTVLSELGCLPKPGVRFARRPVNLLRFPSLVKLFEAVLLEAGGCDAEIFGAFDFYKEVVINKILCTFDNNVPIEKNLNRPHPQIEEISRYIEKNIKKDITIDELSKISNLSVRSIYSLFSKTLSTTPKNYIKNQKLNRVREDLLNGSVRNVTEVALDYGFSHLGRLSSDYKRLFGESPSKTLRKVC